MQLAYFAALLAGGLGFLALAFSVFLPVIIISPSKFAICFTIGSMLILVAFASLRGYRNQLTHMFSKDRLLFTSGIFELTLPPLQRCDAVAAPAEEQLSVAVYLGSMAGTLYAAVSLHSYVLSLVFCAIQVSGQALLVQTQKLNWRPNQLLQKDNAEAPIVLTGVRFTVLHHVVFPGWYLRAQIYPVLNTICTNEMLLGSCTEMTI